jgi:hypothetical protein
VERTLENARSPAGGPDITDLGIVAATGVALLAARTVLEETWISFHRGSIGASSWPAFDAVGMTAFGAALLWMALALTLRGRFHRPLSKLDARLMGVTLVCGLLCAIPGEQWRIATAHLGGARQAPHNWIVWSAARDEVHLLGYLLAHGANANARATNGETALGAAAAAGHLAACELLIARGARLDARTTLTQQTPLIEAAQENRPEVVRLLLARGANPEARDFAGLTAEDWATINGNKPIQELLRARQAVNLGTSETRVWLPLVSRDPRSPS